jgi:hypothetical protein
MIHKAHPNFRGRPLCDDFMTVKASELKTNSSEVTCPQCLERVPVDEQVADLRRTVQWLTKRCQNMI